MVCLTTAGLALALVAGANAHIAAWSKGMYCRNGLSNEDAPNDYHAVLPLVDLKFKDWFMHGACRNFPPPPGEFLELPAGGTFTVEMGGNRAFTTLSYNGSKTTEWPDGENHPEGYGDKRIDTRFPLTELGCISSPNLHCKNEDDAAGTSFAIAYKSDINAVTTDDLVVFTVLEKTPYKRIATYHVPKLMPKCPEEGCICTFNWVPNHCGEANEYMLPYRCKVTNVSPNARKLSKPKTPVWCEGQSSKCVKGAKKISIGYQAEGNTVNAARTAVQFDGQWRSLGYNEKIGFKHGAQDDIFVPAAADNGNDEPEETASPDTPAVNTNIDEPAVKPTSTDGTNLAPSQSASPKRCASHRASSLVKKSQAHARRRGARSFLDNFHH